MSDEQSDALNQIIDKRLLRGEFEPKADNSVYELIKQMSRLLDHPLEESLEVCRRDFETVFMDMIDQDVKEGQSHIITRIVSTFTNCVEILHEHKSISELSWTESGSRQKRYISVLARVIEKYSDTRFISRFEARIQSMVTKRNDVSYFPMKTYCDVLLETEDLCQEFWKSSTIRTAQTGESYSSSYFSGNLDNSSTSEQQVQSNSNDKNVENEQRPCRPCEVLDNKTLYHKMTDCHHVKREMKDKSKNEFEKWLKPLCAFKYLVMFMKRKYKSAESSNAEASNNQNKKKKPELCIDFQNGSCEKEESDCKYFHTKVCPYFKHFGNCKFGDKCLNTHEISKSEPESSSSITPAVDQTPNSTAGVVTDEKPSKNSSKTTSGNIWQAHSDNEFEFNFDSTAAAEMFCEEHDETSCKHQYSYNIQTETKTNKLIYPTTTTKVASIKPKHNSEKLEIATSQTKQIFDREIFMEPFLITQLLQTTKNCDVEYDEKCWVNNKYPIQFISSGKSDAETTLVKNCKAWSNKSGIKSGNRTNKQRPIKIQKIHT